MISKGNTSYGIAATLTRVRGLNKIEFQRWTQESGSAATRVSSLSSCMSHFAKIPSGFVGPHDLQQYSIVMEGSVCARLCSQEVLTPTRHAERH